MRFNNPLVVGYKGEIGAFILNGLLKTMPKASDIWCFDVNDSEAYKIKRLKKSDHIFLCVPIKDTVKWLVKYKQHLKGKTILEQASLKEWIYDSKKIAGLKLVPMHILFRPSATPNSEDRKVLMVVSEKAQWVESLRLIDRIEAITDSAVVCCESVSDHDKQMASSQALVHKTILALGKMLVGCEDTYVSKRIKELAWRIHNGDPELYKFIQSNKYLPKRISKMKKLLETKIKK